MRQQLTHKSRCQSALPGSAAEPREDLMSRPKGSQRRGEVAPREVYVTDFSLGDARPRCQPALPGWMTPAARVFHFPDSLLHMLSASDEANE